MALSRVRQRPGALSRVGSGSIYAGADYSGDPILQQIRALALRNVANAESSAADQRRQALLNFGYAPGLDYGDQATQAAATQNPYSVLAQLARSHEQRTRSLDEGLNKQNLFYSSARGQALGQEATGYLGQQADATTREQALLGQIASGLATSRQTETERLAQAEQDAYQRALQNAIRYGYGNRIRARPRPGRP